MFACHNIDIQFSSTEKTTQEMSGLTKEQVNKLTKGNQNNNNNKVSALLDVRIKEAQKRLNEAHEATAKEAVAHRASEEAKAKEALDDSLAKKAWKIIIRK